MLEQLVHQHHLGSNVSFVGHQANPYPYFAQSDLFVLSSTREGLPTVLIEALAFGMKVVSTDCPSGPREILNDGAYGQLVRPRDSDALAHSIISSLKSPRPTVPKLLFDQYKVDQQYLLILRPHFLNDAESFARLGPNLVVLFGAFITTMCSRYCFV